MLVPSVHVYVVAPLPFKVKASPSHKGDIGVELAVTFGNWFTVIEIVAVFTQVFASVPVTV